MHVDRDGARTLASGFERSARPLGLGPVVLVDTTGPVDIPALAARVREAEELLRATSTEPRGTLPELPETQRGLAGSGGR